MATGAGRDPWPSQVGDPPTAPHPQRLTPRHLFIAIAIARHLISLLRTLLSLESVECSGLNFLHGGSEPLLHQLSGLFFSH